MRTSILFLLLVWLTGRCPAQTPPDGLQSGPPGKPTPGYSANDVRMEKQPVFTVHRLADQVEPGKKYAYDRTVGGRKVSLPFPTTLQAQSL